MDLDGTLLDSNKNLSPENKWALERAASMGIHIVPATGRFYEAIPACLRELPFVRYAITINGSSVIDLDRKCSVYNAEMPLETGLELLEHCRSIGVAYDCYIGSRGYMSRYHVDHIEDYLPSQIYCDTVRAMRIPVEDLHTFVRESGMPVQKVQMFTKDRDLLISEYGYFTEAYPELVATSSLKNNLELNSKKATKGQALKALAEYLGIDLSQVMAIGDGGNDMDMIQTAGVGVAMANGTKLLKNAADLVTLSCDGSGVAYAINKLLF